MKRRVVWMLAAVGAWASATVAGCSGDDGAAGDGTSDASSPSDSGSTGSDGAPGTPQDGGADDSSLDASALDGSGADANGAVDASDAAGNADGADAANGNDAADASDAADSADSASCTDLDGDGYSAGAGCPAPLDCDDTNPFVNPGTLELADDGLDNDCTGGDLLAASGPGVYVNNAGGANCSDSDPARGSKALPYCNIWKAAQDAQVAGQHRDIFVATGTYSVAWGTPANVGVFGGYDPAAWTFDPVANPTIIGGIATVKNADGIAMTQWVALTASANVALQGFTITGGVQATPSGFYAVWIGSSGKIVLSRNDIVGGTAPQTIGVQIDAAATNVTLLSNTISAGTPTTSTSFGVNSLGTATLFGNRVDCGPGVPGQYAMGIQNYGTMGLAANVVNAGAVGASTTDSYGFANVSVNGNTAVAWAVGNAFFGGRGQSTSTGVYSNGNLDLVNNVVGGRSATSAAGGAATVVGMTLFNGGPTRILHNDFFTPLSSGTAHMVQAPVDAGMTYFDTAPAVDACGYGSCIQAGGTLAADPGFSNAAANDFHVTAASPCAGMGTSPLPFVPSGIARRDIDRQGRPQGLWEIGPDEIP